MMNLLILSSEVADEVFLQETPRPTGLGCRNLATFRLLSQCLRMKVEEVGSFKQFECLHGEVHFPLLGAR